MRQRTCKTCKKKYIPTRPMQKACSYTCALSHHKAMQRKEFEKAMRQQTRVRREKLKTKSDYAREAQVEFNRYIRERDKLRGLPCISCGTYEGQMHAGHYRTTKAASQLRYNTRQVWLQCAQCNNHKSGAITEYRIELVRRIGEVRVISIEQDNRLADYSIEYLKRLKAVFRKRANLYNKRRREQG